ncbi:MAG: PAS domain S-box protein, partial [Erysipelothrix sp.]|nr:PAS domain S-box protein [Erysipelothrix sp.]
MFDTRTLALIMSIVLMTQVVALLVQYKVGSQSYQGISWWLVGSSLMAMGFAFMPLLNVDRLQVLALFANPLVLLGQMLLHIGILRFTNRRENRYGLGVFLFSFLLLYYYFIFIDNSISTRSLIVNAALSIMALATSFSLYTYKDKFTSLASVYTATIFLIHGLFFGFRFLWTLSIPVIQTYTDYLSVLNAGFLIPTITTTLWTFGYILMINQRLNIESQLAKEKMQLVFDTSPDAAIISRLSDGRIVDVNENFTILTGYRKDDIINESVQSIIGWKNESDQHRFLEELNQHHLIENMEFIFHRQDQKEYFGSISARIIQIESVPHIVSVLRDITQRKEAEVALIES